MPNFAVRDGMRYGYERQVPATEKASGRLVSPLLMVAYAGFVDGQHQLLMLDDRFMKDSSPEYSVSAAQCLPGCEFIKVNTFRRLKLTDTQTFRAVPGMVIVNALEDARNGLLERFTFRTNTDHRLAYLRCTEETCYLGGYVTPAVPAKR